MNTSTFAGIDYPRYVWTLPKGTPAARLAHRRKHGRSLCGPAYYTDPRVIQSRADCERGTYHEDDGPAGGLRWRWCDDVPSVSIRHQGWYCGDDEVQDDTMRGFVARLPRGRGYIIGWSMGAEMCAVLDYSYVYDSERGAAYAADSMAEHAAERESDYQQKERERIEREEARVEREEAQEREDDTADDWRAA